MISQCVMKTRSRPCSDETKCSFILKVQVCVFQKHIDMMIYQSCFRKRCAVCVSSQLLLNTKEEKKKEKNQTVPSLD